jgi:hypothetical protein
MTNDKTYTEVVVEMKTEMGDLRVDFIDRLNDNHVAVLGRLDAITSGQSAAEERDIAQGKQIDDNKSRLDDHDDDFVEVRDKVRTIGRVEAAITVALGIFGIDRLA